MTKMYLAVTQEHGGLYIDPVGTAKQSQELASWDAIRHIFDHLLKHFDEEHGGNVAKAPSWLMSLALLLGQQKNLQGAWDIVNGPDDAAKRGENANRYERILDFHVEVIEFEVIA